MKEVIKNNVILARYISKDDIKNGLNFFSKDEEYIQVGIWGHYENGKELNSHIHNQFKRSAERTYETLYVINGSVGAKIYTLEQEFVEEITLYQGDILILLECGHGYTILSDDTTVLEVKNGPYAGAEKDRYRF